MTEESFKTLSKEEMIFAFNDLKADYELLSKSWKEKDSTITKAIDYIESNGCTYISTTKDVAGKIEYSKSKPLIYKDDILAILKGVDKNEK